MSSPASRWRPAYVGIGSNLGDPVARIDAAVRALGDLPETRVVAVSSRYRSAPFGEVEQPDFVNAVAAILTRLDPHELLRHFKAIEAASGRKPEGVRWGPRELDLDLLVYSGDTIDLSDLRVPHPGLAQRNFVLLPLVEIAPDLQVPGLGTAKTLPVDRNHPRIERLP